MANILVLANETIGGAPLLDAIRERHARGDARFFGVVPRTEPRFGRVVYEDADRLCAHSSAVAFVAVPPPLFNFDQVPTVVGGPYEYGVPGAVHGVFKTAERTRAEVPVGASAADEPAPPSSPGGGPGGSVPPSRDSH